MYLTDTYHSLLCSNQLQVLSTLCAYNCLKYFSFINPNTLNT